MKIGFIGVGHLASAIVGGLKKHPDFSAASLFLYDVNPLQGRGFEDSHTRICDDAQQVVAHSDYIFVAVRPCDLDGALASVRGSFPLEQKVFISTVAAVSTAYLSKQLGGAKVVRSMPNIPIRYGCGTTSVCGLGVSEKELSDVCRIFSACGSCTVLPESQMNEVIALTGSSPAYVYLFIQAMSEWAIARGFDPEQAVKLAAEAVAGSAKMVQQSTQTLNEMIASICTPGGTTIEAVKVLKERDFSGIVARAMDACTQKVGQLSR